LELMLAVGTRGKTNRAAAELFQDDKVTCTAVCHDSNAMRRIENVSARLGGMIMFICDGHTPTTDADFNAGTHPSALVCNHVPVSPSLMSQ
jgi:hypothetical protein